MLVEQNSRKTTFVDTVTSLNRKLFFESFPLSVLFLLLGMILSFLLFGFWSPYWNKGTSNLISVYEALLYNDHLPQEFFWYPSYLSPQLLGLWYRVLHLVGLIPQYKLSDLPALTTAPVFDATWQNFVTWGRLQSFVIGCVYVCLVTVLIRRLIRMWQIAVLAGVALAFSDGIALAYRIMRSELLSSALVFLALLLTLIAAREGPNGRRFLNLGLAALLVSLSLTEKVQALLPGLTIPVIALAFGKDERDASASAVSQGAWLRAVILCSLGLVLVVPTIGLVEDGLTGMASSHLFQYRPLFANWPGLYQWLLVAYVAFGMVLYASIWRVRPLDTALGLMAVLVGLALGLLALYGRYDLNVVIPVVNPVEHLHAVSGSPGANLPTTSIAMLASQFLTGLGKALAVHTFFLSPSHRPTLLIEWLAIYAALLIWRRGEKQVALQIGVILVAGFAVDVSFTLRTMKIYYAPYTDPFIVLAGAIALTQFSSELMGLRAQRAILASVLAYVIWGNVESYRATYGEHSKGKVCGVAAQFVRRVSIPNCQSAKHSVGDAHRSHQVRGSADHSNGSLLLQA